MIIHLIDKEKYDLLKDIYNKYPKLTLQNNGYEYINKHELNLDELEAIITVSDILRNAIHGFSYFNNFKVNNINEILLRFQYDWSWDIVNGYITRISIPFTGVGYIRLDELLNGFKNNES